MIAQQCACVYVYVTAMRKLLLLLYCAMRKLDCCSCYMNAMLCCILYMTVAPAMLLLCVYDCYEKAPAPAM